MIFKKCIKEIRTDNPSLALTILNVTPRLILPSQKERERGRETHSVCERERRTEREIKRDTQ